MLCFFKPPFTSPSTYEPIMKVFGKFPIMNSPLWAWRRPLVKRMCRFTKTHLEVGGIPAHDPWRSQPWPAVFTFPSRGRGWLSRFPVSNAGELIQQGWLSCRGPWDDLEFRVKDCPKCLSLQQRQILLTDRSTVSLLLKKHNAQILKSPEPLMSKSPNITILQLINPLSPQYPNPPITQSSNLLIP